MRLGVLTGGGDCPGLNAAIRAITRSVLVRGGEVVGILGSWRGLQAPETMPLDRNAVSGILPRGGTILGMAHSDPFRTEGGVEAVLRNVRELELDGVIAIGGEGTLSIAQRLHAEHGLRISGVPKTIDNDLAATDYTFGFDTAVQVCVEAIDRLHTTAESHNRVMVVEVMGRSTGWIAVHAGMAGGADVILVPEDDATIDDACATLHRRHAEGKDYSIVVVAEGYRARTRDGEPVAVTQGLDAFGFVRYGGVGTVVAHEIERLTGYETRVTVLGHVQRGGTPMARDRVLATRFGLKAADLAWDGAWGRMAALRGDTVVDVPLTEAVAELKRVPQAWIDSVRALA